MPWFKVDDKHHDHKKTRKALKGARGKRRDASAMGLWELAGSWCADNLMDGFVPTDELYRWDDDAEVLAARLVAAEYWAPDERDGEAGYRFINWEEHQPMKADVEAKRDAAKERMRQIRSGSRSRSAEVRANETRSDTSSSPTPSRPVPSRPDLENKDESGADAPEPTSTQLALITEERADVQRICEHLAEQVEATGSKRPPVTARWRNEARLMLDRDGRTEEQVHACIQWLFTSTNADAAFWRPNVRAVPKLRAEYDRLRQLAERQQQSRSGSRTEEWKSMQERQMARAVEREREMGIQR